MVTFTTLSTIVEEICLNPQHNWQNNGTTNIKQYKINHFVSEASLIFTITGKSPLYYMESPIIYTDETKHYDHCIAQTPPTCQKCSVASGTKTLAMFSLWGREVVLFRHILQMLNQVDHMGNLEDRTTACTLHHVPWTITKQCVQCGWAY